MVLEKYARERRKYINVRQKREAMTREQYLIDPDYKLFLRDLVKGDRSKTLHFEKMCRALAINYKSDMRNGKELIPVDKQIVVKEEYQAKKKTKVKKEREKSYHRHSGSRAARNSSQLVRINTESTKVVQGDYRLLSKKIGLHMKEFHSPSGRKYLKGKGTGTTVVDDEVEILDDDMVRKGIISHFISSNEFDRSMLDKEPQLISLPSASDLFRKEVLEVMSKPYDKEEHQNCREAMRRSYLDCYPSLRRLLVKYQYKREKRLVIIRGFLFWVKNLTREGVFHPWEDEECLAVEIPSGKA